MSVETIPFKDIYCAGDIVSVVTPTYEPSRFPDIMHQWGAHPSIDSDLENLNLVLVMTETNTYTRTTTNRACTDVTTLTLDVIDSDLELTWTDTTVCPGTELEIAELLGEDNFSWTSTTGPLNGSTDTNTATFEANQNGQVEVSATIQDCPATAIATINLIDIPDLELSWLDSIVCSGTQLEITELIGEDNFNWTSTTGPLNNPTDTNTVTFIANQDGQVQVSADFQGCQTDTTFAEITIFDPEITIVADPAGEVSVGTDVEFTAIISDPTTNEQFEWIYNNSVIPNETADSVFITIIEEGENNFIIVSFIDDMGCLGIDTLTVSGFLPIYLEPNAFTPDGDRLNDNFNITFVDQQNNQGLFPSEVIRFSVWNRWGNLVYNNQTPELGWDGTHDGEPSPSDVYIYYIEIKKPNGDVQSFKGDVTLIR
jgi:gliding motility-associated-like protein